MRKLRRAAISLLMALSLIALLVTPIAAANPTVTITMQAKVVSINNTQDTWAWGVVATGEIVYFSADNNQDDDYSTITNIGTVAVDIEIQGTNLTKEDGAYNLTLSENGLAASETYALNASATDGAGTYTVVVKYSNYNDLTTNLVKDATWDWSMRAVTPTAYNANDDGAEKTATVTLVASEHT